MIKASNIFKSFGNKAVLKGLNLEVNAGETVVILGRSGVGKSVLLKLIIGLDKPDSGTIDVNGICLSALSGAKLYRALGRMGMLFQGSALFDSLSVAENTSFYLDQHGDVETGKAMKKEDVERRVAEALAMVGLEGTQKMAPSSLSGGMRKRAALARLICYRPTILLYDEPTTGLDPITAGQIDQLIIKTQTELQATSLVVTHDMKSALTVGDRLALHHEGQIVLIAKKEEFVKSDHPMVRSFLENAKVTL
ncbi:MAG: ATP-binding cassette domain-containing protein [Verrucomicrobia bacterium]|nr:ATP-binding cassette domain-containing protein [Verrucomicrobiota bacterium]